MSTHAERYNAQGWYTALLDEAAVVTHQGHMPLDAWMATRTKLAQLVIDTYGEEALAAAYTLGDRCAAIAPMVRATWKALVQR